MRHDFDRHLSVANHWDPGLDQFQLERQFLNDRKSQFVDGTTVVDGVVRLTKNKIGEILKATRYGSRLIDFVLPAKVDQSPAQFRVFNGFKNDWHQV